ncbi:MAG: hypothetical protein AAB370_09010, partial [Verrucomicrobiota bacterium]
MSTPNAGFAKGLLKFPGYGYLLIPATKSEICNLAKCISMELPRIILPAQAGLLLNAVFVAIAGNFLADPTSAMAQPGAALWTNRYRESGVFERSIAVGADNGGNIFVAGHSGYYGVNQHYTTIK